jgi:hypothetical protein
MKKLYIITLLLLTSLLSIGKTYALMPIGYAWESYNTYSTYYAMRLQADFPAPVDRFVLTIPNTSENTYAIGGSDSTITTYSGLGLTGTSEEFILSEIGYIIEGEYIIESDNMQSILVMVYQTYSVTPAGYVNYYNQEAGLSFDVYRIKYYTGLVLYDEEYFYGIPTTPTDPTPPLNYEFVGWKTLSGDTYEFTWITTDMLDEYGDFKVFAVYKNVYDIDVGIVEPSSNIPANIQIILTNAGMFNNVGFMIIYVIVIGLLTGALIWIKSPMFIYIIVYLLITGLWIYMGMFPVFVYVVLGLMIVLGLVTAIKGGGKLA